MGLQGESTLSDREKAQEAKRLLAQLENEQEKMQSYERIFVSDMLDRLDQHGERTVISNKQLFWLRDLATKYS